MQQLMILWSPCVRPEERHMLPDVVSKYEAEVFELASTKSDYFRIIQDKIHRIKQQYYISPPPHREVLFLLQLFFCEVNQHNTKFLLDFNAVFLKFQGLISLKSY
jgi:hypothetical protein